MSVVSPIGFPEHPPPSGNQASLGSAVFTFWKVGLPQVKMVSLVYRLPVRVSAVMKLTAAHW